MKAEREKINAKVKADTVRLNGSKLELTADEEMCTFLLVSEGSCTLQMGENDLLLNPGSALLLGAGLLCGRSCTGLRPVQPSRNWWAAAFRSAPCTSCAVPPSGILPVCFCPGRQRCCTARCRGFAACAPCWR